MLMIKGVSPKGVSHLFYDVIQSCQSSSCIPLRAVPLTQHEKDGNVQPKKQRCDREVQVSLRRAKMLNL